ncbi:TetR/AcrR family transcriptional regulator [Salmonirosea aquatica]|uniref:TetR family transcriptional regulator n=1 Tax=Salmonirosea aquatica TaxID=2654236 RepID=A0A7C9FZR0_9BACT|nr:TetR family transcriptional regulator [Cytophagaceae bacterium SJW1-29]
MEYNTKQLQIIEVAERLFASKGFAGTSVRDIAQEADINVAMISYYFGSKEKLIEALFSVRMVQTRTQIEMILQNEELTPLQKVNIWIDMVIDRLMSNQCFHKIMMREQLSTERTPIISGQIMELKIRNMELMKKLITEGQEKGAFRHDVDLTLMVTTLYGTINHAMATQDYLKIIQGKEGVEDSQYQLYLRSALSTHLKSIFKSSVSNEIAHVNQ